MGAVLMFVFGLARGVPIVAAGTVVGTLAHLRRTGPFTRWVERLSGALLLVAAAHFSMKP
jgi:cytochrome c-type biogenesis protein